MVSKESPIKISKKTHGELRHIIGELQQKTDDRITFEVAIAKLIAFWKSGVKKK